MHPLRRSAINAVCRGRLPLIHRHDRWWARVCLRVLDATKEALFWSENQAIIKRCREVDRELS